MPNRVIEIWTDGSCDNNSKNKNYGLGGWAFAVYEKGKTIFEEVGILEKTNSAQMEMVAVIEALRYSKTNFNDCTIKIHSDSAMIINCFIEKWYIRWKETNYYSIKNEAMWREMISLKEKSGNATKFLKVKGHSGIEENERVDFLAGEARKYLIDLKEEQWQDSKPTKRASKK